MNADTELASAWFQALNLEHEILVFHFFALESNLYRYSLDPDAVGLITFHQLPTPAEGEEDCDMEDGAPITGRVLDVSRREGVVDIGSRPGLVTGAAAPAAAAKGKKAAASKVGLYKMHPADSELESGWIQPNPCS